MEVSTSQLLTSRTGADGNGGKGSVGLRVLGEEGWGGDEWEEYGGGRGRESVAREGTEGRWG